MLNQSTVLPLRPGNPDLFDVNRSDTVSILEVGKHPGLEGLILITVLEKGKRMHYALGEKNGNLFGKKIQYIVGNIISGVTDLDDTNMPELETHGILSRFHEYQAHQENEKKDSIKASLMKLYLMADSFDPWTGILPPKEIIDIDQVRKDIIGLTGEEQQELAVYFYTSTIGTNPQNNISAYTTYILFHSTKFGKEFHRLEDTRLKSDGFSSGFILKI